MLVVVLIAVPITAMWVVVMVDLALQPLMSGRVKAIWVIACSLIWPLLIIYWLTRPVQGRIEHALVGGGRRSELVSMVLARESGRSDEARWAELRAQARGRRAGEGA